MNIIIFLIVGILLYSLIFKQNIENFSELNQQLHPIKHVKLNDWGGIEYVDGMPPCARGEHSCTPVVCPSVFEKGVMCWVCQDIIVDQYDI